LVNSDSQKKRFKHKTIMSGWTLVLGLKASRHGIELIEQI